MTLSSWIYIGLSSRPSFTKYPMLPNGFLMEELGSTIVTHVSTGLVVGFKMLKQTRHVTLCELFVIPTFKSTDSASYCEGINSFVLPFFFHSEVLSFQGKLSSSMESNIQDERIYSVKVICGVCKYKDTDVEVIADVVDQTDELNLKYLADIEHSDTKRPQISEKLNKRRNKNRVKKPKTELVWTLRNNL
ncbi:hypothetical protein MAR_021931 [Mya arenaria]|uniref:Uncharacterized protein n=1 Tax=Mya arenaria TaxID=6604 RepID=A0ABY7E967_MYAAR|nr:hypothetical protein MAR_021931 [Mya arenaria]